MIVICPNCNCKFKVGLAVFGRDGRNVRCSACKETWWQEPTLEDVTEEIAESSPEDIFEPEEVLQIGEEEEVAEEAALEEEFVINIQEREQDIDDAQGRVLAYYVAACLFIVILFLLWVMSSSVLKAHPSAYGFYKLLGVNMELPDTRSIMFEGVKAEREGALVTASGRIVNLSRRDWILPMIEVVVFRPIVDEHGENSEEIVAQWVEKPPEPMLETEKEIPFSFSRHVSLEKATHDVLSDEHGDDHGNDEHAAEKAEDATKEMYMVRVHFVVRPQLEESHDGVVYDDQGEKGGHDKEITHDAPEAKESHNTHGGSH